MKQQILDTFGNREWLAIHFTKAQITDSRVAYALQYPSQLLSPLAVLEKAQLIATGIHRQYQRPLEQYQRAIGVVGGRLPGLIGRDMDADAVKLLLETVQAEVDKIPVPIPDNTRGPAFFGTWSIVITGDGLSAARLKNVPSQQTMPPTTLDTVYKTAHLMVQQLDTVIAAAGKIPWAGVDMFGSGPWDNLNDADRAKLDNLIGMDGRPGQYHEFVWSYYYEWGMLLQSVAQWLYLTCQPDKD